MVDGWASAGQDLGGQESEGPGGRCSNSERNQVGPSAGSNSIGPRLRNCWNLRGSYSLSGQIAAFPFSGKKLPESAIKQRPAVYHRRQMVENGHASISDQGTTPGSCSSIPRTGMPGMRRLRMECKCARRRRVELAHSPDRLDCSVPPLNAASRPGDRLQTLNSLPSLSHHLHERLTTLLSTLPLDDLQHDP